MSYIGLDPQTQLLNTSTEFFSGNAVNMQFTLARSVASASDLDVMIGQTLQRPFADYEAENVTLTFQTPPASGTNNITVTYRAGALNSLNLTANAFGAGTVGAPSVYSVAANNTGLYWANATSMVVTTSGANRAFFNGNVTSVDENTGVLVLKGGLGVGGNIHLTGHMNLSGTEESANVTTGALTVAGGAGIVGNLNVGGDITCVGDFTVNGTFTTTGTDSLEVNDPFIFLANANPGDTYDSGFVTQYFTDVTRYSGLFRDITDAKYKLFGNLTNKPSTTVDTANVSFAYNDLVLANLSATGNVNAAYFVGNGAALTGISTDTTQIYNGTSKVIIAASAGNIVANVGGTTIGTFSGTGLAIVGAVSATTTVSATGNVIGGNITTAGQITGTGNVTSAANVSGGNIVTGGLFSAAGNVTGGNVLTGGLVSATGNVTGGNLTTAGQASAGGNVTGGNVRTPGIVSATGDVYGNNFSATTAISAGTSIAATTSITAGTTISAVGTITGDAGIVSSGNVSGANVLASGYVSATGNVFAANLVVTGNIYDASGMNLATGAGNITLAPAAGSNVQISSNANITVATNSTSTTSGAVVVAGGAGIVGNVYIGGLTSVTGNISSSANVVATANLIGGNVSTAGLVTATGNVNTASGVLATGNVTGGNILTAGIASATGNITGGNITTGGSINATGAISATANVVGGNLVTAGAVSAGGAVSATGNVTGGNITTAGLITSTGNITSAGNIAGGNLLATALVQGANVSATANIVATGNITAATFLGSQLSLSGNVISQIATTSNVTGANVNATAVVSAVGNVIGGNLVTAALVQAATVSATGNITGGNISTAGNLAAPTAAQNTNTTAVATTAFVLGQLSSSTPAAIASAGAVGTGTTFARADHTHSGVSSITGSFNMVTASASAGAVTLSLPQQIATSSSVQFGSLTVTTGNITLGNIINGGANLAGNIGSATGYFNTVFAKATSAQYADLAEAYRADAEYPPGTVVSFGGDFEVTLTTGQSCSRVAGVISTNPAHVMNAGLESEHTAVVALTGRVPTSVVGAVQKGDMMVSAGNGRAQACATPAVGTVIGKALENFDGAEGVIEVVVGRL